MTDSADTPAVPDDDSKSTLRALMEECLERVETDGLRVIDDVCSRHPELASDLRRRLKQLFDLGLLGEVPTATEQEFPERLGEFRLLRCLGGGGMGVVYLAEQESLGRQVALKLVRPEHLYFPGARERFQREAEAVARLKHPGIVPIHAVGEENGLPFFAMEWVEGATLADVVRDAREVGDRRRGRDLAAIVTRRVGSEEEPSADFAGTWSEACVRVARDVARALDHAHRQGVLHRDVKPSNVMVTADGRVRLLDFGLASLGDGETLTKSGSQLGSMAYMAPEQVRGEAARIDERTDVYALGVTLYELIALRRPFPEGEATRLQMRILSGDPESLRRVAPDVPWDVETVCLKAMELDPERRYASAGDLARDLDNVLALRPIVAARPGAVRRVRQWVRRHPARAVGLVLSALLLVGVPLTWFVVQARAAERVRATLGAALDGVDSLLARMVDPEVGRRPETVALRQGVLEDATELFRRLDVSERDPVALRERMERLRVSVANLRSVVGETQAALDSYDEAVRRLDAIGTARAARLAADVFDSRAAHLLELGEVDRAERAVLESLRRWDALLSAEGPREPLRRGRLEAVRTLAGVLITSARHGEALAELEAGVEDARGISDVVAAPMLSTLGALRRRHGDEARARAELEEALERGVRYLEGHPGEAMARTVVGDAGTELALMLQQQGELESAERLLGEMLAHRRALVESQPDRPAHRDRLTRALLYAGELQIDLERRPEAEETFLEAARLARALVERYPDHIEYRTNLSSALGSAGDLAVADRPDEARPQYQEAVMLLTHLSEETPESVSLWVNLGLNQQGLWNAASWHGAPEEGLDAAFRALDAFERALALDEDEEWAHASHLFTARTLIVPLRELGRADALAGVAARLERWHRCVEATRLALTGHAGAASIDAARAPAMFDAIERALENERVTREDLDGPGFDEWRGDPRLRELLEGVKGD